MSKPLLTDNRRIYACLGKNLVSFDINGPVVWFAPLGYICSPEYSPVVDDRGKIYLIAEDRILKITPSNISTSKVSSKVFFGTDSTIGGSGEIIGLSISILYSSIFTTIKNRGLFALSLDGELLWSAGPILYRFGYRQGCKENLLNCYFSSAPVVDHCEGTIYISNTEGQLYSIYMRNQQFRWVHDFSSIDKIMTAISGNNGLLFVIFPKKALVIALDVHTGNMIWQRKFGPLSTEQSLPVVDSNGWLSIGSLDGYLYSFSPMGEMKKLLEARAADSVIQASPVLDCSGFAVFVLQTVMTAKSSHDFGNYTYISAMKPERNVLTMLTPATETVYWTGNYPGELINLLPGSDLGNFILDERIFLPFLSSSRTGTNFPCYSMSFKNAWTCSLAKPKFVNTYAGNEGAVLPFIFFQLVVVVLLVFCVFFCFVFWRKNKLQGYGLVRFLDRRKSLHHKRKAHRRMISKLEQRIAGDKNNHDVLNKLGEIAQAMEEIGKNVSTSYSLGPNNIAAGEGFIFPLSNGKVKSNSFLSSNENTSASADSSGRGEGGQICGKIERAEKGKEVKASSFLSSDTESGRENGETYLERASSSKVINNPMFSKQWIDGS